MPSAAYTFANTKDERLVLARLKAFLLALRKLALAERMNAARAEIERGSERLWLKPDYPPAKKSA
jgi:hypothetical protein